ncbi:MAG TPA: tagaturonate reductase, partial [Clostridia bacterium]|nr:tagaturonate reductase [Clostridia bacterium]
TGEVFHLWVIEGDKNILNVLPFDKLDLNVILTNDLTPYRDRKVRILNGAHTMTVLAAYLYGKDTVKECVDDELVNLYMRKGIFEEIIPTLDLPKEDLIDFANSVLERFANPFIQHYLLSISLNSVSKFRTRVLPSILEYAKRKGRIPQVMSFSFAALMAFYRGERLKNDCLVGYRKGIEYEIRDDVNNLVMFKELWDGFDGTRKSVERIVKTVFSKKALWDMDLNEVEGLADLVAGFLFDIVTSGIENTMKGLVYG